MGANDKPRAGELINVLREAKQKVPEDLLNFGTTGEWYCSCIGWYCSRVRLHTRIKGGASRRERAGGAQRWLSAAHRAVHALMLCLLCSAPCLQ